MARSRFQHRGGMRSTALALVLLGYSSYSAVLAGAWTCKTCPLSATAPVCDADGILYPNDCVARCQGVTDLVACGGASSSSSTIGLSGDVDGAAVQVEDQQQQQQQQQETSSSAGKLSAGQFLPEARRVTDGSVTWEVMNQLADQGFRFLGRFEFLEGPPTRSYNLSADVNPTGVDGGAVVSTFSFKEGRDAASSSAEGAEEVVEEEDNDASSTTTTTTTTTTRASANHELHITVPEGYVYVRTTAPDVDLTPTAAWFPATSNATRRSSAHKRHQHRRSASLRRKLLQAEGIIGYDTRTFRSPATGFPAQAILWLRFQNINGLNYMCSASLVAPSVVLTAGHCVFTPGEGAHMNYMLYNGATTPTGSPTLATYNGVPVTVKSFSTLARWTQYEDFTSDVAVLYLDQPLGSVLGYFGTVTDTCRTVLAANPITTYGYPGDKTYGTQWGDDYCQISYTQYGSTCDSNGIFRHDCDIAGGQSGSPIYDASLQVRGVVSFAQEGELNGSPYLGGTVWTLVRGAVSTSLTTFASALATRTNVTAAQP